MLMNQRLIYKKSTQHSHHEDIQVKSEENMEGRKMESQATEDKMQ